MKKPLAVAAFLLLLVTIIALFFAFRQDVKSVNLPRSVTALRLKTVNPVDKVKLTGRIGAWREESLSFEVPGRIKWIIDKGSEIKGGDSSYAKLNSGGALIGKLDPADYQLKLKSAQANLQTAQAQLNALRINVKEVVSSQLAAAKADFDNAEKEYNRFKVLLGKKVISQQLYDTTEAGYIKSKARLSEVQAFVSVKNAEIQAAEATLEQHKQAVADAELGLKRTELRVTYPGQIAAVSANIGDNVSAGQKVARLVVLDPVSVELNVSPVLDRKIHYRQFVQVYPPGGMEPITAMVNRKSAVADPSTHTFSLELLVRNKVVNVAKDIPETLAKLPRITGVWPVGKITSNGRELLVVHSDCVNHDGEGDFVWKAHDVATGIPGAPVFQIEKVRVELLPGKRSFFGSYDYRVLKKPGGLKDMDFVATGVPQVTEDGAQVMLVRTQRIFRPGDLVKVVLSDKQTLSGIYVPLKIVSSDTLKNWVFKVARQPDGSALAKQVFIQIRQRFNDWVLIDSAGLSEDDLIVFDGAHFIIPDEQINVKSIEKLSL